VADKKKGPDEYPATTILRNNPGMLKDCWIETKDGEVVLRIRQVRFGESGGPSTRTITLVDSEIQGLVDTIARATGDLK
jgi:hypothetical protein